MTQILFVLFTVVLYSFTHNTFDNHIYVIFCLTYCKQISLLKRKKTNNSHTYCARDNISILVDSNNINVDSAMIVPTTRRRQSYKCNKPEILRKDLRYELGIHWNSYSLQGSFCEEDQDYSNKCLKKMERKKKTKVFLLHFCPFKSTCSFIQIRRYWVRKFFKYPQMCRSR